jgi:hypothetical protein
MMDRIYGFPASARHFHLYEHDSAVKRHPAYLHAKQGNDEAAFELVWSLASEFLYGLQGEFSQNTVYVSPFAREASGDNAIPPLLVELAMRFSYAIFLVASLGFLGLGVQPPSPDWGLQINEARSYFTRAPWMLLFPAGAISLLVVSTNLMTDGLRDILNPDAGKGTS